MHRPPNLVQAQEVCGSVKQFKKSSMKLHYHKFKIASYLKLELSALTPILSLDLIFYI